MMISIYDENGIFNEIQYAVGLKEFINNSRDVAVASEIKLKILNYEGSELLLVTKKISSPTQILDVKLFDDDAVKEAFPSFLSPSENNSDVCIRKVRFLQGRAKEKANNMGLIPNDLVVVTTIIKPHQLPIYELEKIEGDPLTYLLELVG